MDQALIETLKNVFAVDRSAESREKWAKYIVDNKINMEDLLPLLDEEHPIGMRFTWVFGDIVVLDPSVLEPIVAYCFEHRDRFSFPGFDRTVAKLLCVVGIPEEIEGLAVDQLFNWILDPKIKVAVKVFAIDALGQLCFKYPAFKGELLDVIDDQLDKNSVAFRARAKRVIKYLGKIK